MPVIVLVLKLLQTIHIVGEYIPIARRQTFVTR